MPWNRTPSCSPLVRVWQTDARLLRSFTKLETPRRIVDVPPLLEEAEGMENGLTSVLPLLFWPECVGSTVTPWFWAARVLLHAVRVTDPQRAASFWRGRASRASECRLVARAMTDLQRDQRQREALRRELDGHWEYVCRVTSPAPFDDDEWGRGGIMTISVSLAWTGVTAKIIAERLWATTSQEDNPDERKPLAKPTQWKADGGVIFYEDELSFKYFSGEGRGVTKDSFKLVELDGTLYLGLGRFEHQRADGRRVEGTVQLRKMRNFRDFQWAPEGVNPAGTVAQRPKATAGSQPPPNVRPRELPRRRIAINLENAGHVIIGDVSAGELIGTVELPLASGDLNSLAQVFSRMGVPSEDVNQISKIVESEKPKQGRIGSRAAEWVGGVVAKSLTGALNAEKEISPTALSEIIQRFYGLK